MGTFSADDLMRAGPAEAGAELWTSSPGRPPTLPAAFGRRFSLP
jgi:hypothetical protein